jgi:hypothetical protein
LSRFPGIEAPFLIFDGDGLFRIFKGFFTFPEGRRQEIVATLSILLFIKKALDETGRVLIKLCDLRAPSRNSALDSSGTINSSIKIVSILFSLCEDAIA